MTLRYIRNYLRYSLRWATSSSFRNAQCSQLLHLPTPYPLPPALPVGTSVTCKINTRKKTKKRKRKLVKNVKFVQTSFLKEQQDIPGNPEAERGGGDVHEKILETVMKLPSINRQLYMLCISVRSMAFFCIWKLTR